MTSLIRSTALLATLITAACSDPGYFAGEPGGYYPPDTPAVTPGGAQDIGFAREIIHAGGVPAPDDFTAEGLLSEHDLPTLDGACDSLLCLRPALGLAPSLTTGQLEYWLHIGMTTGVGELVRPPMDMVVLIDKSASMSIDMDETNEAVSRLIDQLRPDDRLAVIAFDTALHTLHELGPITDRRALKDAVHAIRADGGFDIELATRRGYEILQSEGESQDRMRRVMLLSCGYPSASGWFSQLVHAGAAERIGLSFIAVLLGYHPPIAELLGQAMGGAYHYTESLQHVIQVFDNEFDYIITPVAYDLDLALDLGPGYSLDRVFGVPGHDSVTSVELGVSTVFFSKRRGGLLARVSAADTETGDDLGRVRLSYTPEPALGFDPTDEQAFDIRRPATAGEPHYDGLGVRKAAFLINQYERMVAACTAFHERQVEEARDILVELIEYMETEAAALGEDDLYAELELVRKLHSNML